MTIVPSVRSESALPSNPAVNTKLEMYVQKVAGSKQPVPNLPDIAVEISDKTYKLEPNFLSWSDMTFHFDTGAAEAIMTMSDSPDLKIGLDDRYRLTDSPNSRPIGLRGQWVEPDTLNLDYIVFGDFIRSNASITFADQKITIKIKYLNWDSPLMVIHGNLQE